MEQPAELHEHAEQGREHPELAPVTVTMAILAVLVAATSLMGHDAHTEEILAMTKASDQWNFYQAKNIRAHTYEVFLDLLSTSQESSSPRSVEVRQKYEKELQRYTKEKEEIQAEARNFEKESDRERRQAGRFDLGEGLLEAAVVIASLTLLTNKRLFWFGGIGLGAAGVVVGLTAFLVH
jgi:hypothetical protein